MFAKGLTLKTYKEDIPQYKDNPVKNGQKI